MKRDLPFEREVSAEIASDIRRCKSNLTKLHAQNMDVSITVGGCETEHKASVFYEFTPAERRTWDYPGYPAQAEILHVYVGDTDIVKLMSQEALKELSDSLA